MTDTERRVVQAAVVVVDLVAEADPPADAIAVDNALDALAIAVSEWRLDQ